MLILGFDTAIKNLGICLIEFDDQYAKKFEVHIQELMELYDSDTDGFFVRALSILKKIHETVANVIKIRWMNVLDIYPDRIVKTINKIETTKRLKTLLCTMDEQLPEPDLVLIEYQMKQNDITRLMSAQILYHYSDIEVVEYKLKGKTTKSAKVAKSAKATKNNKTNSNMSSSTSPPNIITYGLEKYSLKTPSIKNNNIECSIVGCSVKNTNYFCEEGKYENFIVKYSNYVANKAQTNFNFKYFMDKMGYDCLSKKINNKTTDIADTFMMIIGYIRENLTY